MARRRLRRVLAAIGSRSLRRRQRLIRRRVPTITVFAVGVAGLFAFTAFAVLRPLASSGAYYGPRPGASGYSYTWSVLAAFPAYLLALASARRPDGPSVRTVLAAALVVSVPLVFAPLIQSQDLYGYLFYGRMQLVHGANPYLVEQVAFAHDPWFGHLVWQRQVSVYGPLWSLSMVGVVWASGGSLVRALLLAKCFAFGLVWLTVWGLLRLAHTRADDVEDRATARRPAAAMAAFALNPLVLATAVLSGHADAAVAAAFVWAVVADRRGRPIASALLLGAATLVKFYAGLVLLAYLIAVARRDGVRKAAAALMAPAALAVVAFAPYWSGPGIFAGLVHVAGQSSASLAGAVEGVTAGALRLLHIHDSAGVAAVGVRIVGVLVIVAVLVLGMRRSATSDVWPGTMTVMAAYILVTPWFLPWHLLGLLALACAVPASSISAPTLVFSGSCLASVGGLGSVSAIATSTVRYGPPAFVWFRCRRGIGGRLARGFASRPPRGRGPRRGILRLRCVGILGKGGWSGDGRRSAGRCGARRTPGS